MAGKGGRPRKEIDMDLLRRLVRIQCTAQECADALATSPDTIDRRLREEGYSGFAEFYKKHSVFGKASLRRAQWKSAIAGNPTMLVWLGKQYLGQTDKQEIAQTVDVQVTDARTELQNLIARHASTGEDRTDIERLN